jgi:hypothetical protein
MSRYNGRIQAGILKAASITMKALLASTIVLATIALAFSIGIASGYAVICGILNAFSHHRDKALAAAPQLAPTVGD